MTRFVEPKITIPSLAWALAEEDEHAARLLERDIERAVGVLCKERFYSGPANLELLVDVRFTETAEYLIANCEDPRLQWALASTTVPPLVPLERFARSAKLLRRAFRAWIEQAHRAGDLRGVEAELTRAVIEASLVVDYSMARKPQKGDHRHNRRAEGVKPWAKPRKRKTARRVAPKAIRAGGLLMKTAEMLARDLGFSLADLKGAGKPGRQTPEARRRLQAQRKLIRELHRQGKSQAVIAKLLELPPQYVNRTIRP